MATRWFVSPFYAYEVQQQHVLVVAVALWVLMPWLLHWRWAVVGGAACVAGTTFAKGFAAANISAAAVVAALAAATRTILAAGADAASTDCCAAAPAAAPAWRAMPRCFSKYEPLLTFSLRRDC